MLKTPTLDLELRPLMDIDSIETEVCAICGRPSPIERHHIVWRSQGKLYDENGKERPKPTITICGFGNNLRDADGVVYCHGAIHHRMLHLRNEGGRLQYLWTAYPTAYYRALDLPGWHFLGESDGRRPRGCTANRYKGGELDVAF